jgi:AcrR family transcriptional regulator
MSSPAPDTRTKILQASWKLLEDRRGIGVRMGDIAKAAGVSRQALYLHFKSKIDLVSATRTYVDGVRGLEARLEKVGAAPGALEKLEAYVGFWAGYLPEIHGLARALYSTREVDEASAAAWEECMGAHRAACAAIVGELEVAGMLAPGWSVETAAQMLFAVLSFSAWEQLVVVQGWSDGEYTARMMMVLRGGMVA